MKAPLYCGVIKEHELYASKPRGTDRLPPDSPSCLSDASQANSSTLYLPQKWLNMGKNQRIQFHLHSSFSRGKQYFSSLLYFYILFSSFYVSKTEQKGEFTDFLKALSLILTVEELEVSYESERGGGFCLGWRGSMFDCHVFLFAYCFLKTSTLSSSRIVK